MGLGLSGLRLGLGQRAGARGPTITTAPVISGDPSVEANTLTLTTAPVWDGAASSSYVWQLNNGGWADVAGSTGLTTIDVATDEHIYDYRVLATATNADGTSTATSNVLEGLDAPVLSNFTDNLDQDPPNALFDSTEAGTLTWDFDASATPPSKGAGDIGTGTDSVTAGANDIDIDLSAYPDETGYLHLRVTNDAGDSNVLTSQEITVPVAAAAYAVNGVIPYTVLDFENNVFIVNGSIVSEASAVTDNGDNSYTIPAANLPQSASAYSVVSEATFAQSGTVSTARWLDSGADGPQVNFDTTGRVLFYHWDDSSAFVQLLAPLSAVPTTSTRKKIASRYAGTVMNGAYNGTALGGATITAPASRTGADFIINTTLATFTPHLYLIFDVDIGNAGLVEATS